MITVKDIDIKGKRVLVRVDFNVPMDDKGDISDDIRIRTTLPTICYIRDQGGKVVLCSHMGRPKGEVNEKYSLGPIASHLGSLLEDEVRLAPDCIGNEVEDMVASMKEGEVILLENLRFHKGETDNDAEFARKLAS
ncbi:MAG TPA: phosphoglycerate kinase, partial [Desulfopila sp.]|nr:phosphoglycerate kinase [Desulfopila sp.]